MFSLIRFRQLRAENIQQARLVKDTLTNPKGFWKYPANDERVKKAQKYWLARARRCHAIIMGREPIIKNMLVMDERGWYSGPVYLNSTQGK